MAVFRGKDEASHRSVGRLYTISPDGAHPLEACGAGRLTAGRQAVRYYQLSECLHGGAFVLFIKNWPR